MNDHKNLNILNAPLNGFLFWNEADATFKITAERA